MRICSSCAATAAEAPFPPPPRPRGTDALCCACIDEGRAAAERLAPSRPRAVRTRASYRAAYRIRQQSPQMDLVDLVMPCP